MLFRSAVVGALLIISAIGVPAGPNDIFVDSGVPNSTCVSYSPDTRTCAAGRERAYTTIAAASAAARPGMTVWLREGTYNEPLRPANSGTDGAVITYSRYQNETPRITGSAMDPAIDLSGRSYVVIDGLTVSDVVAWLRAEDTHHSVVRNSTFRRATATGSRAGVKFVRSTFNRIVDNTLEDGNDNVMLVHADRNVVERNTFRRGRHALWAILCGNFNIVRNNDFENEIQKIGQVTDCEGAPSDATPLYDATRRNLIEGNRFGFTPSSGGRSPFPGIQYAAQQGIVRRNTFQDMTGPGIQMSLYSDEARHNTDNRIYHNVFYGSQHSAIDISRAGERFGGNVFVNNLLYRNRFTGYASALESQPVQVLAGRLDGFLFRHNNILGDSPGQSGAVVHALRNGMLESSLHDLAWWQENRSALFARNTERVPMFQNEGDRDFRPADGSPMRDAGGFLTTVTSDGSGTRVRVADASYFSDGFDIPGEVGDLIQLRGDSARARIVDIDYESQTLILDRSLTWRENQELSLAYNDSAPDIGAFESGDTPTAASSRSQGPSAPRH
jgi:hypothetical protein